MANFQDNAITDTGRLLLADCQAGAEFVATKLVIGAGYMPPGKTARTMTAVVEPIKNLAINKKERTNDGKVIYGGIYSNADITTPFYFREFALYAKARYRSQTGEITSEGSEVLYSYGNAGATADYMPAYSTSTVVERQMDLVTYVGNDTKVELTVESGVYLTRKQAEALIEEILADLDMGYFTDGTSAVMLHDADPSTHSGLEIDGNENRIPDVPPDYTLADHAVDEDAHTNIIIDGNEN